MDHSTAGWPSGRDDAAFTEYVSMRSRALFRTAYLLVGDRSLAEDLVQTALVKTYVAWGRIRADEAVDAYVRRTMVTTLTSWWRRSSWRNEQPYGWVPERLVPGGQDEVPVRVALWDAIQRLPMRQRTVVVLRFYEDLSEAEVARTMGCSVGTVKSQTHAAIAKLRSVLGDDPAMVEER